MGKPHVLILAGGSGTRLWPLSRENMPKQFLAVCGERETLLQLTVRRMLGVTDAARIHVVASSRWQALIAHQLMDFGFVHDPFIEEPEGRNTAPAIALGVAALLRNGADAKETVLVCPSDHLIGDEVAFQGAVRNAVLAAESGRIVTFGITPTRPETGFGYIKTSGTDEEGWCAVSAFVEKPDAATARHYLDEGGYYWNGGYFGFRIEDLVRAFEVYFPEGAGIFSRDREVSEAAFLACPKISMDYAIMEKMSDIACVPLDARWSDVGSWDAVYENSPRDESGNVTSGNVELHGSKNSLVLGGERLICALDLDNLIVVDTPDALFLSPRGSSQRLGSIVKSLKDPKVR